MNLGIVGTRVPSWISFFEQAAILYEELTSHGLSRDLSRRWCITLSQNKSLTPAEWQSCLKSLQAADNLASKTELTDLTDSQDRGDWTLISGQSRRKNPPHVMNVSLRNR